MISLCPVPRWYLQGDKRPPRIRPNTPAPTEPQERPCTPHVKALDDPLAWRLGQPYNARV